MPVPLQNRVQRQRNRDLPQQSKEEEEQEEEGEGEEEEEGKLQLVALLPLQMMPTLVSYVVDWSFFVQAVG